MGLLAVSLQSHFLKSFRYVFLYCLFGRLLFLFHFVYVICAITHSPFQPLPPLEHPSDHICEFLHRKPPTINYYILAYFQKINSLGIFKYALLLLDCPSAHRQIQDTRYYPKSPLRPHPPLRPISGSLLKRIRYTLLCELGAISLRFHRA